MIYVGTGITENYFSKAQHFHYFTTLNVLGRPGASAKAFAILLDYSESGLKLMQLMFPNINFVELSSADVRGMNPNKCLQHGAFIERLSTEIGLKSDDYVFFTDSDITIQRGFEESEIKQLLNGSIFVAPNWHDEETLAEELPSLQPLAPELEFEKSFLGYKTMRCFNTGVFGATVKQWGVIYSIYVDHFSVISPMMVHYAKQQWLLSWILQRNNFPIHDPLSSFVKNIHTHGHEPMRAKRLAENMITQRGPYFYRGDIPLLFAHNLR